MLNFIEIGHSVAEIGLSRFFIFQDGGRLPSRICSARLDHLYIRRTFGRLYHCAKFGWNRCSLDNMQVSIFCELGWKTPIHARNGGFGI